MVVSPQPAMLEALIPDEEARYRWAEGIGPVPTRWQLAARWRYRVGASGITAGGLSARRLPCRPVAERLDMSNVRHGSCPSPPADKTMLRITVTPESNCIRLKLEGVLAGTWVTELEESWRAAHSIRGDRRLYLDLTAVEHVDRAGEYLLALLRCSGAHLIASGTVMTELLRTIAGDWPVEEAL